jgi:uncharacterized SAM-binding protein YcdF (DUF218 family)
MSRSAARGGLFTSLAYASQRAAAAPLRNRARPAVPREVERTRQVRPAPGHRRPVLVLLAIIVVGGALGLVVLLGPGFILDTPQPPPTPSDAIVVISGDEQLARFREGVRLYEAGYGKYLVFSGAALDNGTSNAEVMRDLAVASGIPGRAILEDSLGEDTWGNAVHTRELLSARGLKSAILVTSPYHARRAKLTFDAAYKGTGISLLVHAAPDSEWRKLSWWQQAETRRLTFAELQKLAYIAITGQYH